MVSDVIYIVTQAISLMHLILREPILIANKHYLCFTGDQTQSVSYILFSFLKPSMTLYCFPSCDKFHIFMIFQFFFIYADSIFTLQILLIHWGKIHLDLQNHTHSIS